MKTSAKTRKRTAWKTNSVGDVEYFEGNLHNLWTISPTLALLGTSDILSTLDIISLVDVLDGGKTSVTDRLPFLDTVIVDIYANATSGLGVILEHRYCGAFFVTGQYRIYSFMSQEYLSPVQNLTTDSLRYALSCTNLDFRA
jgi:hypothetical protein